MISLLRETNFLLKFLRENVRQPVYLMASHYCNVNAGNPRVTPEVTRDVCLLARMMAANLYYSQIEDLMFEVFCN